MRILGVDYGDVRVGLAISDPLGITAQGLHTIINKGDERLALELSDIIRQYGVEKVVIGMPKNMKGEIGERGEKTKAFASCLEKVFDGEIIFWDERLTTISASRVLNSTNTRREKRKAVLDTVSAAIILENYLNSLN